MIKLTELFDSINRMIISLYPKVVVYTPERQPKDFTRPSFLIEHIRTSQSDINRSTVEKIAYFTVTGYLEVDKYHRSDALKLIELQDNLLNLFNQGYVKVGERAIKLRSSSGGTDIDKIYIDLTFEYFDDRTMNKDNEPLMSTVTTTYRRYNHGIT